MADIALSVCLPAYLEEENLRLLLPRLKTVLKATEYAFEIIVMDTMTPMDATESVCAEHGARYVPRRGDNTYGSAVRTGIEEARGTWCVFMDADGSHSPEFIPNLLKRKDEADVVIASRYVEGGHTDNSKALILMSRVLNWTYAIVLGIRCKDVSNSFRLYNAAMLKSLTLKSSNFDIVEEILYKLVKRQKARIVEVPFSFKQRMFGETKRNLFVFILTYLWTLVRLRLRS